MGKRLAVAMAFVIFSGSIAQAAPFYFWRYREHPTDCRSLTDGKFADLCWQEDIDNLFKCVPDEETNGTCDSAAEWKLALGGPQVSPYREPLITSFTNDQGVLEIGSSVTATVLSWAVNKTMTTQTLDNGIGSFSATATSYTHTNTYTTNRTYTLTVGDGVSTATATTSVSFRNANYYGVSANTSLTSGQVNALTSSLATSRVQSDLTFTPSAQYLWICYPASYGAATFTVNGLQNNDWVLTTENHTNSSGATVSYRKYRSGNLLTGTYIVDVL